MTDAEKAVRAKWPDAYCYKWGGWRDGEAGFTVARDRAEHIERIGHGDTEDAAWEDAQRRIEAVNE